MAHTDQTTDKKHSSLQQLTVECKLGGARRPGPPPARSSLAPTVGCVTNGRCPSLPLEYREEGCGDSSTDVTPEAFYKLVVDDADTDAEPESTYDDVAAALSLKRGEDVTSASYVRRMAKSVLENVRKFHGCKQTNSCVECGASVSRDDFLVGELRCGHLKCKRCFMKNMWVCRECVNTIEDVLKTLKTLRTVVPKFKRDAIQAINLMTLDIKSFKRGWYVKIVADTDNQDLCSTCARACSRKSVLMVCGHRLCYECYYNSRNTDKCMVCYILRERMYDQAIVIARELK
jgi:hypothetical protein